MIDVLINSSPSRIGIAFNSGYPSYILTVHPSLIPPGKCLDTDGSTCDCGSDGQTCAPQCRYDNGNLCECGDDGRTCLIKDGGSAGDVSCLSEEEGEEGVLVECPE